MVKLLKRPVPVSRFEIITVEYKTVLSCSYEGVLRLLL
jgi:hypothetical protein